MFDDKILQTMTAKAENYASFTNRVKGIGKIISEELGISVRHDPDMNYSRGQKLSFWVNHQGISVGIEKGDFEIALFISSKGKLCAWRFLKKITRNEWGPTSLESLPGQFKQMIGKLTLKLESHGYQLITDDILDQFVPGHYTEMDEAPATLFNVLFSELF